jgi:hypothetical protein
MVYSFIYITGNIFAYFVKPMQWVGTTREQLHIIRGSAKELIDRTTG